MSKGVTTESNDTDIDLLFPRWSFLQFLGNLSLPRVLLAMYIECDAISFNAESLRMLLMIHFRKKCSIVEIERACFELRLATYVAKVHHLTAFRLLPDGEKVAEWILTQEIRGASIFKPYNLLNPVPFTFQK